MTIIKPEFLAALFASLVSQGAVAGFTTNDLYLGLTLPAAQSDYIIDLGQPKAAGVEGTSVADLSNLISASTFSTTFPGGANEVTVAVVGGDNVFGQFGVYATQPRAGGPGDPAVAGSSITADHTSALMSGGASQVSGILGSTPGGLPTAGNSVVDPTKSYTAVVDTLQVAGNFIGRTGVVPFGTFDTSDILYLDLYHATVATPYTYLGFFTVDMSAATPKFTFTPSAAPGTTNAPPPPPTTLSIARIGTANTISFLSSNTATYKLFFTNSAGLSAPVATWPSLPGTLTGDGSTKIFTDTATDPDRVYRIRAN